VRRTVQQQQFFFESNRIDATTTTSSIVAPVIRMEEGCSRYRPVDTLGALLSAGPAKPIISVAGVAVGSQVLQLHERQHVPSVTTVNNQPNDGRSDSSLHL